MPLTWSEVCARRLGRSSLAERAPAERLIDVVRLTGGIHAQVQASAELQLAARIDGITVQDVRHALWRDRTLVKAWTLRGTLHLHPADELAMWFAARRAVSGEPDGLGQWSDPQGVVHPPVSASELIEIRAAVWEALDGRTLLRDELTSEVVSRVGAKHEPRLRSGFAFFTDELCQGPPHGSKVTFVRPDQWIHGWEEVKDEDEALREVCRRYLHAYGPARPRDFAAWYGPMGFESLGVEEVDIAGHRAYLLGGDTEFPEPQSSMRLLPEYDVYVMGFREREHLVPEPVRQQVAAHGRGRFEGAAGVRFLMVDGIAAGLWERKRTAKRIELTVRPVLKLSASLRRELDREVERIGAFLGLEPVVTLE